MTDLNELEITAVSGGDGELKQLGHDAGKAFGDWLQNIFEMASRTENVYVG